MMYGGVSLGGAAKRGPMSDATKAARLKTRIENTKRAIRIGAPLPRGVKVGDAFYNSVLDSLNYQAVAPVNRGPRPLTEAQKAKVAATLLAKRNALAPKKKRKPLTAAQKQARNERERNRRAVKRAQDILTLTQGQATTANKNLLLNKRIFGKAERKQGFPANWNHAMTQADKVELSNWLATHWQNEKPPRGYGEGMESDSDSECDEMMAGGAMIKHRDMTKALQHLLKPKKPHHGTLRKPRGTPGQPRFRPVFNIEKRKSKKESKGAGIGTTIGSIADALFGLGDPDMELMAGGAKRRRGRPRKHRGGVSLGGVALGGESMADALRHEIDVGRPRVVGDRHLLQSGEVLRAGVSMGGAKRGRGRPRKHMRGGIDWGKVAETALPLALSFL